MLKYNGAELRAALAALPEELSAPNHVANEFVEEIFDEGTLLYTNYRRVFLSGSFPQHADSLFVDVQISEGPWNVAATLAPADTQWSVITPDNAPANVRYRAVNPNGEVTSPVTVVQ